MPTTPTQMRFAPDTLAALDRIAAYMAASMHQPVTRTDAARYAIGKVAAGLPAEKPAKKTSKKSL